MHKKNKIHTCMNLPVIVLILSSVTLVPTIIVLFYSAITYKKTHQYLLAGLLISTIFYYLPFFLSNAKLLHYVPYMLKFGVIFYLTMPALLTLYIKSFITKSFQFKKKYLFFLIGPFIAFLDYLYFHIQNYAQLDEIVNMIEKKNIYIFRLEGFIPFELNLLIRFIYILPFGYYLIKINIDKKKRPFLTQEDKTIFAFLKYLLIGVLCVYTIFFVYFIITLNSDEIDFTDSLTSGILIISGALIMYLGLNILLSPQLLFDLKETRKKNIQINNENSEEDQELLNAIETKMGEEKFYLNENFSSQQVLTNFEISRSKLDELLVQRKGISFADWLNSYRIEYAKNLLLSNDQYTIDALSNMSGFSSRSAFYAAFKKITQITPTEYINQSKKGNL
jgi:AraC-like DNA-binding protein